MNRLLQRLRYALRRVRKNPGFAAVALLSLSLGICIATCAFSEMNGMVLRNLAAVSKPAEMEAGKGRFSSVKMRLKGLKTGF